MCDVSHPRAANLYLLGRLLSGRDPVFIIKFAVGSERVPQYLVDRSHRAHRVLVRAARYGSAFRWSARKWEAVKVCCGLALGPAFLLLDEFLLQ